MAETVAALRDRYGPALLIHWEDFASRNSYRLLKRFRNEVRQTQLPSLNPGVVCLYFARLRGEAPRLNSRTCGDGNVGGANFQR